MNKPTQAQINKLPKWVQDHIKTIERERDTTIRVLNDYLERASWSPFSIEDGICTGEHQGPTTKTRYIQTEKMLVEHAGVRLAIHCDNKCIVLQWEDSEQLGVEVAMVPQSYQRVHLVSRDDMRHR